MKTTTHRNRKKKNTPLRQKNKFYVIVLYTRQTHIQKFHTQLFSTIIHIHYSTDKIKTYTYLNGLYTHTEISVSKHTIQIFLLLCLSFVSFFIFFLFMTLLFYCISVCVCNLYLSRVVCIHVYMRICMYMYLNCCIKQKVHVNFLLFFYSFTICI